MSAFTALFIFCLLSVRTGVDSANILDNSNDSWGSWLLNEDEEIPLQQNSPPLSRRITPKSVFIVPSFNNCQDGYELDGMGRCVKIIRMKDSVQLSTLVEKLKLAHAKVDKKTNKHDNPLSPQISSNMFGSQTSNFDQQTNKFSQSTNSISPQIASNFDQQSFSNFGLSSNIKQQPTGSIQQVPNIIQQSYENISQKIPTNNKTQSQFSPTAELLSPSYSEQQSSPTKLQQQLTSDLALQTSVSSQESFNNFAQQSTGQQADSINVLKNDNAGFQISNGFSTKTSDNDASGPLQLSIPFGSNNFSSDEKFNEDSPLYINSTVINTDDFNISNDSSNITGFDLMAYPQESENNTPLASESNDYEYPTDSYAVSYPMETTTPQQTTEYSTTEYQSSETEFTTDASMVTNTEDSTMTAESLIESHSVSVAHRCTRNGNCSPDTSEPNVDETTTIYTTHELESVRPTTSVSDEKETRTSSLQTESTLFKSYVKESNTNDSPKLAWNENSSDVVRYIIKPHSHISSPSINDGYSKTTTKMKFGCDSNDYECQEAEKKPNGQVRFPDGGIKSNYVRFPSTGYRFPSSSAISFAETNTGNRYWESSHPITLWSTWQTSRPQMAQMVQIWPGKSVPTAVTNLRTQPIQSQTEWFTKVFKSQPVNVQNN